MKNTITKTLTILSFLVTPYFFANANDCREVKLECKESKKADGDYSPADRSICRTEKLLCKLEEEVFGTD